MRFPNMGDGQNIEGRFLGLCSMRYVVRMGYCTAVLWLSRVIHVLRTLQREAMGFILLVRLETVEGEAMK